MNELVVSPEATPLAVLFQAFNKFVPFTEKDGNKEIEETVELLQERMDLVRKEVEIDSLGAAITLLEDALRTHAGESRIAIQRQLMKAFLVRYALYGWIEDLDACAERFNEFGDELFKATRGSEEHSVEVQAPAQFIKTSQDSIKVDALEGIVEIARETLSSHSSGKGSPQIATLWIILGNALVMKYLCNGEVAELDQHAIRAFQQARLAYPEDLAINYTSLTSLAHVEWLIMEHGVTERTYHSTCCWNRALTDDAHGTNLGAIGAKMVENAIDDTQFQKGIAFLAQSLYHRLGPHPRRFSAMNQLACALLTQSERVGVFRDLDECIKIYREMLNMRPRQHPSCYAIMFNLACALQIRFREKEVFQDLEESIILRQEALTLLPSPHPDRPRFLASLGNSICTRFQHKGASQDLEESIAIQRESLDIWAPPKHNRHIPLINLAAALIRRFEQKGALQDLEECITLYQEALDVLPSSDPDRYTPLGNLANAFIARFHERGVFKDLETSITLQRESLALRPPPHPDRYLSLTNLASALHDRFEYNGEFQDLNECINLLQEALDLVHSHHSTRPFALDALARALAERFDHDGTFQDLEECITLLREALCLRPHPHPNRSTSLGNLACYLTTRFKHKKAFRDLDESIILHREALDLERAPDPSRVTNLHNLANALSIRFEHNGAFQDLDESIIICREALNLLPISHTRRPSLVNNLSALLHNRFRHKGISEDLAESITLCRETLNLDSPSHPERVSLLHTLASSLISRFDHQRTFQDIEECIPLYLEALDLLPPFHLNRSSTLGNLATALHCRFNHKGALQDLEESITLCREALNLLPSGHSDRPNSLNNLASRLSTRFTHKGLSQDLEGGITLFKEALGLFPPPHTGRSGILCNLGHALSIRFEQIGTSQKDKQDALDCFKEAVSYPTGRLVDRLQASKYWTYWASKYFPELAIDAYSHSMELLPQIASLDLTLRQRQDVLQHFRQLAGDAAKWAVKTNNYDAAVTFLSTGRSIFWSQALQLRTPVDELMADHPAIAEKFVRISKHLENASYGERISASRPSLPDNFNTSGRTYESLYTLANQRQQVLDEIRRIPCYENFLLPPSFSSLQPAANDRVIVLLNASENGCDALIMRGTSPVERVPLHLLHINTLMSLNERLSTAISAGMRGTVIPRNQTEFPHQLLERDMDLVGLSESSDDSSEATLRVVLGLLWLWVVDPVLDALGHQYEKSELPRRIWWCPTGPFVSLPIHAAGLYDNDNVPMGPCCLFQYAVSSYCTSPQDLLHSAPEIAQSYKMTAIIEPEAPGAAVLPATRKELKKIEAHIPDEQQLIAHVGSKDAPSRVEQLVSDIQQSSFVHFGCHGMQDLKDPLDSYLLLSGGKLTMSKIIQDCRVPEGALAYLSACETAKGDEERPDESLNLVATMMFAGFRSVVGTLWSIMDEDAPIVADVFYRHLFRNGREITPDVRDAAYGLHLATKELRDQGKPFRNWVPYVHYGI